MSLQTRLSAFIAAVGADIKALQNVPSGFFGDGSDGAWIAQVTPTNVMANPDAAVNANGWSPFTAAGGSNAPVARVVDAGFTAGTAFENALTGATGSAAHILYPGGVTSFTGSLQNVVPGQVVDFSGQVKAQLGAYSYLKLVARWLKADGSLISEVDVTGAIQNTPTVGTVYSLSGSLTAPANAAYAGVEVIGLTPAGGGNLTFRASSLASRPLMPGTTRSGAVYTMTRDVYFTDLTVNAGVTIVCGGYKLHTKDTLSGAGTISANGNNAAGQGAGLGADQGSVRGGFPGGSGGAINGNGNPVGSQGWSRGNGGTSGGAGGASGARTGGNIASISPPSGGLRRSLPEIATGYVYDLNVIAPAILGGGGGSGGGAGSTTAVGGGGGGAGGLLIVLARVLSGTLAFEAKGGNGAQGGTNAGGGGAGAGGAIHLLYGDKSGWTGTTSVVAGSAGVANGTGAAGAAGVAGNVIQLEVI